MKKFITVNKETMAKLMKTFKVNGKSIGERCVKNALAYRSSNDLARKIRFMAIQNGGVTYCVNKESETWFDSDSSMHQGFPNGAELYIDKATGAATIYDRKGRIAHRYPDSQLSRISEMQREAAAL